MPSPSVLGSQRIMAFVGTQDPAKPEHCLRLISEDGFALAFNAHGIMLRVSIVQKGAVAPYAVLGWYQGMSQDELGVWNAPGGARIAWFKDPDGNTLSIAQL